MSEDDDRSMSDDEDRTMSEDEDRTMSDDEDRTMSNDGDSRSDQPKKDPLIELKMGCLICKQNWIYSHIYPSYHDPATGAYVCGTCTTTAIGYKITRLTGKERLQAAEEYMDKRPEREGWCESYTYKRLMSKLKDEVTPQVITGVDVFGNELGHHYHKDRLLAEGRGLWDYFLSSDVSSRPLVSKDARAYAFYRLQTIKYSRIVPGLHDNSCHDHCPCPHREADPPDFDIQPDFWGNCDRVKESISKYPGCTTCYSNISGYECYRKHCHPPVNCGFLYCVYCRDYFCDEHLKDHPHPLKWVVSYEKSHEYARGRIPVNDTCTTHGKMPYMLVDMTTFSPACHVCAFESPNTRYIYYKEAGSLIRDRLATALTTDIIQKGNNSNENEYPTGTSTIAAMSTSSSVASPASLSTLPPSPSPLTSSIDQMEVDTESITSPPMSIPDVIKLFKETEGPLFDLLSRLREIDEDVRSILPVHRTRKQVGRGWPYTYLWEYDTPLDEQRNDCRRLWGEASNDLINRVEVYAKSRYGIAGSLEHCLKSLEVSSLLRVSESIESKQEGEGGDMSADKQSGVSRVVSKGDVLDKLNQHPVTRERVGEEIRYLRTIECLRETLEYGDPHFFTLTKEKIEVVAKDLNPTLEELKERIVAIKPVNDSQVGPSFIDQVKTLITNYSSLLKAAGKLKYWRIK